MSVACDLRPCGEAGSSLLEVLVSLLLISISTLGLAALQISAKQLGHQASQRTQAVTLAGDLLARMRANSAVLSHYAVEGIGIASGAGMGKPVADCRRAGCGAMERSAWDLWEWEGALNGASTAGPGGGLVRALACIVVEGRRVVVAISWAGSPQQAAPDPGSDCSAAVHGDASSSRQALRLVSYIGEAGA